MKTSTQYVTTLKLIQSLRDRDSWCGETHLQKSMFFLENLAQVPTNLGFILYKHGPYSFDFSDVLDEMRADRLIDYDYKPPYGPRIKLTADGKRCLDSQYSEIKEWEDGIDKVAECLGKKGVVDLEKLGTALLVRNKEPELDLQTRAKKLHILKPHVDLEEAVAATRELDQKILPCFC